MPALRNEDGQSREERRLERSRLREEALAKNRQNDDSSDTGSDAAFLVDRPNEEGSEVNEEEDWDEAISNAAMMISRC